MRHLAALVAIAISCVGGVQAQEVPPVLEFPQEGLDDTAAYQGYVTRFFRDPEGNPVQVVMNRASGRIVNVWGDAANESISFTVREAGGAPAQLFWGSAGARITSDRRERIVEYKLRTDSSSVELGLFLLGSMRKEREFQYQRRHLNEFGAGEYIEEELALLLRNLERLPAKERDRQLAVLHVNSLERLKRRLSPSIRIERGDSLTIVSVQQSTIDGKTHLSLKVSVPATGADVRQESNRIAIRFIGEKPFSLTLRLGTDSPSLTPLTREEIFTQDFMSFYSREKHKCEEHVSTGLSSEADTANRWSCRHFQWLDRQVKSAELLSYEEKLMAGLPNFATYFGRDMMMTALMMEPIWSASMQEHVIASVLRKLSPEGNVSHEEALGGQAIRENAGEYNLLIERYFHERRRAAGQRAARTLAQARELIGDLQRVRENYIMVDDDFQLPVLEARYLARADIPSQQKRAFLLQTEPQRGATRLSLLIQNLFFDLNRAERYVDQPDALHLVSFPQRDHKGWLSASWRDSDAGYGHGRFPMDVNVIWVPKALESMEGILTELRALQINPETIDSLVPKVRGTALDRYLRKPEALEKAISVWKRSARHFRVSLGTEAVRRAVRAKLKSLNETERRYWEAVLQRTGADARGIDFLSVSLDSEGRPVPIVNTDPAAELFLGSFTEEILQKKIHPDEVIRLIDGIRRPYPVGLFVEGLGPLVANDAYSVPQIWETFKRDRYHSPRVVWGREVNLFLLGLSKQILAARDEEGSLRDSALVSCVRELQDALKATAAAVEASGLKQNELWSYRIEGDRLLPVRYPTSSDVQLWNVTDLAVQYLLDRLSALE